MRTLVALVATLLGALPLAAQQEGAADRPAVTEHAAPQEAEPSSPALQQPQDMQLVLRLREEGMSHWRAGRFPEAEASFREALRTLDSLAPQPSGHGTIGIFPHYLLFMPPLNF